jgi:hypothetical protein
MPKFMYPKFYIKAVGGQFSIEHRLTHTYIESVDTEKELVERIKHYVSMGEKDFWEYLIYDRYARIPKPNESVLSTTKKEKDSYEEWFVSAWSIYTDLFYTKNPKLLVEETKLPYDVITQIRREKAIQDKEETKKREQELREAEERFKEEQKVESSKKKEKVETVDGKLGSSVSLDRLKRKKRKGIKKLKVKTKSKKTINIVDSDDPFA